MLYFNQIDMADNTSKPGFVLSGLKRYMVET